MLHCLHGYLVALGQLAHVMASDLPVSSKPRCGNQDIQCEVGAEWFRIVDVWFAAINDMFQFMQERNPPFGTGECAINKDVSTATVRLAGAQQTLDGHPCMGIYGYSLKLSNDPFGHRRCSDAGISE